MLFHRALPKEIPDRKKKIAIKKNYSPVSRNDNTPLKRPRTNSSSSNSRNIHKISSKEKPHSMFKSINNSPKSPSYQYQTQMKKEDPQYKIYDFMESNRKENPTIMSTQLNFSNKSSLHRNRDP